MAMPSSPSRIQLAWGFSILAGFVALAVAAAWPIYVHSHLAVTAAIGFLVGAGLVLLGWALRWRWWAILAAVLGGYMLTVVPAAIPSAMTSAPRFLRGIADGMVGIVTSWKQLLTIATPAGTYQGVLVPFFVVTVAFSAAAAALMLFAGRRAPLAAGPLLLMVLFGLIFGTTEVGADAALGPVTVPASRNTLIAVAAVAAAITWQLGRARIERATAVRAARSRTGSVRLGSTSAAFTMRRYLLAGSLIVVTAAGALAAAPVAQKLGPREVLREEVDPLLILRQQQSPLSTYRQWFAGEAFSTTLFTVSNSGQADRLRIATLDTYDGQTFHVAGTGDSARFARQPHTQQGQLTVTIGEGYQGIWVPLTSADGAPQFSGPRAEQLADAFYASAVLDAGVIIVDEGGLRAGDSYRIDAVPSPSLDAFAAAQGGVPLISEDAFPALAAWVEDQEVGRTGADLATLVHRLRERGYLTHATAQNAASQPWISALSARADYSFQASRAGHSGARVEELFTELTEQERRAGAFATPESLIAAVGDDEQFATAAALLANYLGFESRVVVGVRLGDTGSGWGVEPCVDVCTGANVTAWAEARQAGGAWVPLDATPQFENLPILIREGQTPPQNPTEPDQVASDVIDPPAESSESVSDADSPAIEDEAWTNRHMDLIITIATITIGALLILAPLLVFPVAKALRRTWRRRAPVPEVAMVGAWHELIDTYVDHGIEVPHRLTRLETADLLDRPAAATLAAVIDRAVFAEHPPTKEASEATWDILAEERRAIASSTSLFGRIRATMTPASLMRHLRARKTLTSPTLRRKDRHVPQ